MHLNEQLHFLKREFQHRGDLSRRLAPPVHPQGLRPLIEIQARAWRRRNASRLGICPGFHHLFLQRLHFLPQQCNGGCFRGIAVPGLGVDAA